MDKYCHSELNADLMHHFIKEELQYETSDTNEDDTSNDDRNILDIKKEKDETGLILENKEQAAHFESTTIEYKCELLEEDEEGDKEILMDNDDLQSLIDCDITSSSTNERSSSAVADNFYCQICEKNYASLVKLKQHMFLHRNIGKFRCHDCNKGFNLKSVLRRHIITVHYGLKHFMCDVCDKTFKLKYQLTDHKQRHINIRNFICEICSKGFVRKGELRKHHLSHTSKLPKKRRKKEVHKDFDCSVCFKKFTNNSRYKSHIKMHTSEKKYLCQHCGKSFREKHQLSKHITVHDDFRMFPCNQCSKTFKHKSALKDHKLRHEGIKSFYCDICEKAFFKRNELKRHSLVHIKKFACEKCGEYFFTNTQLSQHLNIHSGLVRALSNAVTSAVNEQLILDQSDSTGEALSFVKVYIKEEQVPIKEEPEDFTYENVAPEESTDIKNSNMKEISKLKLSDNVNDLSYKDEVSLIKDENDMGKFPIHSHLYESSLKSEHNSDTNKKHQMLEDDKNISFDTDYSGVKKLLTDLHCEKCDKYFVKKWTFRHHMLMHSNKRRYNCTHCKKCFYYKSELNRHAVLHDKKKSFECTKCDKSFKQKCTLYRHLLRHDGIKKFECTLCDRHFSRKIDFSRHSLSHAGIKKFKCYECDKHFILKGDLKQHIIVKHLNVKKFKCQICGNRYGYNSTLRHHLVTHTEVGKYECNICKKQFKYSSTLKYHIDSHSGIKRFQCNECHKSFMHKDSYNMHVYQHMKTRTQNEKL